MTIPQSTCTLVNNLRGDNTAELSWLESTVLFLTSTTSTSSRIHRTAGQSLVSKQKYLLIIPSFFLEILLSRCCQYWRSPSLSVTLINWEPVLNALHTYWLWSTSKDPPTCRKTSLSLQVIFSYLYSVKQGQLTALFSLGAHGLAFPCAHLVQ